MKSKILRTLLLLGFVSFGSNCFGMSETHLEAEEKKIKEEEQRIVIIYKNIEMAIKKKDENVALTLIQGDGKVLDLFKHQDLFILAVEHDCKRVVEALQKYAGEALLYVIKKYQNHDVSKTKQENVANGKYCFEVFKKMINKYGVPVTEDHLYEANGNKKLQPLLQSKASTEVKQIVEELIAENNQSSQGLPASTANNTNNQLSQLNNNQNTPNPSITTSYQRPLAIVTSAVIIIGSWYLYQSLKTKQNKDQRSLNK